MADTTEKSSGSSKRSEKSVSAQVLPTIKTGQALTANLIRAVAASKPNR